MLGRPRRRGVAVKKHWVRRWWVDYGRCRCRSSWCPAGLGLGLVGRCSQRRRSCSKPSSNSGSSSGRGRRAAVVGDVIGEPGRQLAYTGPSWQTRLLSLLLDRRCRNGDVAAACRSGDGDTGDTALRWNGEFLVAVGGPREPDPIGEAYDPSGDGLYGPAVGVACLRWHARRDWSAIGTCVKSCIGLDSFDGA